MQKFWINLGTLLAVIVVNALANILPINGLQTGEISDLQNVLFTPAGYVFSIWSLIYILLIVWVLRQWPEHRRDLGIYVHTHTLFWLSNILNIAWILLWHYQLFLGSVIVMIALLLTLITLYKIIQKRALSKLDLWPFSVYLGWISVATIANIAYYLTYIGWGGFGISDVVWTILLLIVALLLATWFRYTQNDLVYPLVFIWAIIGIAVRNQAEAPIVASAAYVVVGVLVVMMFIARKHKEVER
ncbi:TspO and MBR related proteins [Pelagirhabdus alkalitolerans]|uniref:TspO and MBR related proteins n=1 Tax=Pelagirhabdus alkalitolerans TaxID=1612202 RepID=A0A1G6GLB4_9BACI|nr:TspO/MBR family protein [Pelagirhabdus alkalitolerans]SDB82643.1 TspO and MBR related proteins [Pelagirhabdus alkalitolerans]